VRVRAMIGAVIPASIYLEALHRRPGLLREFVTEVFDRCDVLLTPTLSIPVPTLAETDVGSGESMWKILSLLVHCTAPFNYLGVPAMSVPAGFTWNGLPASMQLVARPFAEMMLFRVAGAYQSASDWHERVPS
jgi:aspartyl-tRNA(Asn)/glutamyl-tRNA(Gln) amidotransferase subunit A